MNTQTKHTPGPWRVKFDEIGFVDIYRAHDDTAGSLNNYAVAESVQSDGDARLIAASPDLLAALEWSMRCMGDYLSADSQEGRDHCYKDLAHAHREAIKAISKAKGEA